MQSLGSGRSHAAARPPSHTWEDDFTLKVEISAGMQTRYWRFARPQGEGGQATTQPEPAGPASGQGNSVAEWIILGGRGDWTRGGNLQVVTTGLKARD